MRDRDDIVSTYKWLAVRGLEGTMHPRWMNRLHIMFHPMLQDVAQDAGIFTDSPWSRSYTVFLFSMELE